MTDDKTTMKVEKSTRDRLADLGKKGESFDTIINRVLDEYQKKRR
jgi:hypothetical protein